MTTTTQQRSTDAHNGVASEPGAAQIAAPPKYRRRPLLVIVSRPGVSGDFEGCVRPHRWALSLTVVERFGFDGGEIVDRSVGALGVEPVDLVGPDLHAVVGVRVRSLVPRPLAVAFFGRGSWGLAVGLRALRRFSA
ncbi:hypothetical protein [Isoptericola haloaureus]|uniref:Uncharacterized protein n=1 Tax=Isoptericola haloaureus TaxID=1542902 RepID=A0ABU7Z597_9MICO